MPEVTRKTVLGLKEEVTRGTPVAPAATSDFTALQGDFTMAPAFQELENAELRNSLAPAKNALGLETPTCSLSHYLRPSDVAGTAPDYSLLIESAFGAKTSTATEYSTTTGSSTSVLKLSANADSYERGEAVMIKDTTNGYSIRPILSTTSTTDLNLGFNAPYAPATGMGLGKAVLYKPATLETDYPTMSLWGYRGNGGAVELIAGARTTEMSATFTAGEYINASFSLEGTEYYFNPIVIGATSKYIDFNEGASDFAVVLTEDTYKDPYELAAEVQAKMDAQGAGTITCTYSPTAGTFTITNTAATFNIQWKDGTNTANSAAAKLGFSTAANSTGAQTYTGSALSWAAAYTPAYDSADPRVAKCNEVIIGSATSTANAYNIDSLTFTLANEKVNITDVAACSGVSDSAVNGRTVEITASMLLKKHDAKLFYDFRTGTNVQFLYNWGTKSAGNWVAGKCASIFCPTMVISAMSIKDLNGFVAIDLTLKAYADASGNGEVYLNFI